jgi:hypothetical protein
MKIVVIKKADLRPPKVVCPWLIDYGHDKVEMPAK